MGTLGTSIQNGLDATANFFGDPTVAPIDATTGTIQTPPNGTGLGTAIVNDISAAANTVYNDVLTPLGHAVVSIAKLPGQVAGAASGVVGFAGWLPWIIIGIVVLVILLFFFAPGALKTAASFLKV